MRGKGQPTDERTVGWAGLQGMGVGHGDGHGLTNAEH